MPSSERAGSETAISISDRRRRGSPWTGLGAVIAKETADHLSSARMRILEALVFLTAIAAAYAAIRSIRATIGESPFLFLRLLTLAQDPLPSFIALLGFLIPLVAIALAFDAINGEFNRRTKHLRRCFTINHTAGYNLGQYCSRDIQVLQNGIRPPALMNIK